MSLPGRFRADTEEVSGYRDPLGLSELCLVPVSNISLTYYIRTFYNFLDLDETPDIIRYSVSDPGTYGILNPDPGPAF
jgi:hypothetical protein